MSFGLHNEYFDYHFDLTQTTQFVFTLNVGKLYNSANSANLIPLFPVKCNVTMKRVNLEQQFFLFSECSKEATLLPFILVDAS